MAPELTDVTYQEVQDAIVLGLPSDVGAQMEDVLSAALSRAFASAPRLVVVDHSRVKAMNSAGIGLLFDLVRRAQEREIPVALAGLSGQPKVVMEHVRLTHHVPSFDSVEAAVDSNPTDDSGS